MRNSPGKFSEAVQRDAYGRWCNRVDVDYQIRSQALQILSLEALG